MRRQSVLRCRPPVHKRLGGAMPSTYTQNFYHAVFSTKQRAELIVSELERRLYKFIGGILRDLRCKLLAVNGTGDHIHLLIKYPADLSHSEMLKHVKGRSSKWANETFAHLGHFAWQEGYGGFTVSRSMVPRVKRYISRQKEHHKRQDFRAVFLDLRRRHDIEFDERDVFK